MKTEIRLNYVEPKSIINIIYYKLLSFYFCAFAGINTVNYFTVRTMNNVKCTSAQHAKNIYKYKRTKKKLYNANAVICYKMRIISNNCSFL
jgi:hypothetical protein